MRMVESKTLGLEEGEGIFVTLVITLQDLIQAESQIVRGIKDLKFHQSVS